MQLRLRLAAGICRPPLLGRRACPPHPPARSAPLPQKSEAQVTGEIQAIIRQITASVTFLPLLQDKCEETCHTRVDRAPLPGL